MKLKKMSCVILGCLLSTTSVAAITCNGAAYGLKSTYIFTATESDDLSVSIKTVIDSSSTIETGGVARYSSTTKLKLVNDESIMESYYIFVPDKNSYTELIGISADLKSMARSRPDPDSNNGNFIRLECSGDNYK